MKFGTFKKKWVNLFNYSQFSSNKLFYETKKIKYSQKQNFYTENQKYLITLLCWRVDALNPFYNNSVLIDVKAIKIEYEKNIEGYCMIYRQKRIVYSNVRQCKAYFFSVCHGFWQMRLVMLERISNHICTLTVKTNDDI